MSRKYKSNHNVVYSCQYHVVWCPKYRQRVLIDGVDARLKPILHEVATERQAEVIEMEAIRVRDGQLVLSKGRGNPPLVVPWRWNVPTLVELGWTGSAYELRRVSRMAETVPKPPGQETAGIDVGDVHLAVVHDGKQTTIFNGRTLQAQRQYQNKIKAVLSAEQSHLKKGSRRWRKLQRSKRKQLRKLDHQINDILHKQTTALVSTLHESRVQTEVLGDVRDLRQRVDYGPAANQRIHQMVTNKAERLGMQVVLQDEAYTSQECRVEVLSPAEAGRWIRVKEGAAPPSQA